MGPAFSMEEIVIKIYSSTIVFLAEDRLIKESIRHVYSENVYCHAVKEIYGTWWKKLSSDEKKKVKYPAS